MKKKIAILFVAMLGVGVISCSNFLDVNTDPNNSPSSTPALTLPAAIASSASEIGGYYNILGGMWVQYWTQDNASNQYKDLDSYNIQQSTLQAQWAELYNGALEDYQYVRNQSKATGDWNLYLMGTVMQCYTFQMLTDLYDQIPFNEALQGASGNFSPHYLGGQQVYDSLIARIDFALAQDFSAATVTKPGNADLLFSGNIAKWKQFANTLKLKIYLRQWYARQDVASAGITKLYANGGDFLSQDAAMTQFVDQENKSNPLYEMDQRKLNTATNIRGSETFLDFLIVNNDPRIDKLFIPGSSGQQGLPQGDFGASTTDVNPNTISRALLKAVDPVYFLCESESYFLQSEAALRGFGGGDAEDLYKQGIGASLKRLGLTTTEKIYKTHTLPVKDSVVTWNTLDSLVSPGYPYEYPSSGSFEDQLKAIITQKWVALAGIEGIEAFFERNRTNYPSYTDLFYDDPTYNYGDLVYPIGGVTGKGVFPKRLLFPQTERSRNPNTPAQVPATQKIWWDKKP